MSDPEIPGLLIRRRESQGIAHWMGEECRVEVCSKSPTLHKVHPLFEVLGLYFIPVDPIIFIKDCIGSMEIDLLLTRNQGKGQIHIRHQFLVVSCSSWVVSCGLDTSCKRLVWISIKAPYVIPLPNVKGNGGILRPFNGFLRIHTDSTELFFCFLIAHYMPPSVFSSFL